MWSRCRGLQCRQLGSRRGDTQTLLNMGSSEHTASCRYVNCASGRRWNDLSMEPRYQGRSATFSKDPLLNHLHETPPNEVSPATRQEVRRPVQSNLNLPIGLSRWTNQAEHMRFPHPAAPSINAQINAIGQSSGGSEEAAVQSAYVSQASGRVAVRSAHWYVKSLRPPESEAASCARVSCSFWSAPFFARTSFWMSQMFSAQLSCVTFS